MNGKNSVRVKICGITNREDAWVAIEAGADLLGFILYPPSPRYVEAAIAAEIVAEISANNGPLTVGVLVNESAENVARMLDIIGLDLVQLHGDEEPEMLTRFVGRSYKALRPRTNEEAEAQARRYALAQRDVMRPALMLDAYDPGLYGGTGAKADWQTAHQLADVYPGLMLAGGLTPANVGQAIVAVQPWAVDVASGVERAPGLKDHDAVRKFVEAVKGS